MQFAAIPTTPLSGQFTESGPTPDAVENVMPAERAANGPESGVTVTMHVSLALSVAVKLPPVTGVGVVVLGLHVALLTLAVSVPVKPA